MAEEGLVFTEVQVVVLEKKNMMTPQAMKMKRLTRIISVRRTPSYVHTLEGAGRLPTNLCRHLQQCGLC